ncbi:hypothetical protein B0H13DRAFT_2433716 [Mycena leptocephala]|nr:hypothetical protein B0H13DRAFT_2433716 [Mycena leptocephala]
MGPLLVKAFINFAKARAAAKAAGVEPANIGHSVGMAFGLLIVIVLAILLPLNDNRHPRAHRSPRALYRRTVHLTPAAHLRLPNSAVLNHVSMDVSRVDACAQWFHAAWTAPIQTTVCLIILLVELGPSALAGFALFLIIPLQERIMAHQFSLHPMRVVKYFCYEGSFLARLFRIRTQELRGIRKIQHSQSASLHIRPSPPDHPLPRHGHTPVFDLLEHRQHLLRKSFAASFGVAVDASRGGILCTRDINADSWSTYIPSRTLDERCCARPKSSSMHATTGLRQLGKYDEKVSALTLTV